MSESCNHNCSSCGENCGDRKEQQSFLKQPHPESTIRRVIGVVSGKGGVGKSSVTTLLAVALAKKGKKVAILDADITGPSIPRAFHLDRKASVVEGAMYPAFTDMGIQVMSINMLLDHDTDPVIWRGPVIAGVVQQFWTDVVWTDVDAMLVDMPPGTGDVPLTVFQSLPIDGIVVVTSPQQLVSMIVTKAINMSEKMDIPILGLVENMSYFRCPDCGGKHYIFGDSKIEKLAEQFGIENTVQLPIEPALAGAFDKGTMEDTELANLNAISGDFLKEILKELE